LVIVVRRGRGAVKDSGMMSVSQGRRGILQTRVPIACVAFVVAACAVVSCGSAGTGAPAGAGAAGIPAVTSPCAVPAARPGREVAGTAGSFSVGGQLDGVAAAPASGVWAAGSSTLGNPLAVRWDGRAWKRVPAPGGDHLTSPEGGYLNDVAAASADDAWAVGAGMFNRALIEHWDGAAWTRVPSPDPEGGTVLNGVAALSATNAWAVGGTNDTGQTVIEHWDGDAWTQAPSPTPAGTSSDLYGVAATSASNAWAVGQTDMRTGSTTLIEHWDGTAWTQVPSPAPPAGGSLAGVAATSAANAWAVGSSSGALIEHWNGRAWTLMPSPALGRAGSLHGVAATSPGNAWAVGGTVCPGRGLVTVIEHWNGRTWTRVPTPAAGILTGVATASAASAWAVGFWTASGNAVIEHWDGTAWTSPAGFCSSSSAAACLPAGSGSPAAATTQPARSGNDVLTRGRSPDADAEFAESRGDVVDPGTG
jgi:hypothetical protein